MIAKKTWLAVAFIGAVVPGSQYQPTSSRADEFSVMTWNLEWFFDDNLSDNYSELGKQKSAPGRSQWNWRRDEVANSIAKVRPTILALQEVENRRVLWYLSRALDRNHRLDYHELGLEGRDFFTEQDVGFLFRSPADVLMISQGSLPRREKSNNQYFDISKHLIAVFEVDVGESIERVTVMNLHLRSKPEAESLRIRQARLAHRWISDAVCRGENVIVLGDLNTEEAGDVIRPSSDVGVLAGLETENADDDLFDLNLRLPTDQRQTHGSAGRQFDRILCSASLIEDSPSRPDLVFKEIQVRRDLTLRGGPDGTHQHWDAYWELPQDQRDLSDHYPVIATFEVR